MTPARRGRRCDGATAGVWSYSAMTRCLLELGLRTERWLAAKLDVAGARLAAFGADAQEGARALTLLLVSTRDVASLMMVQEAGPAPGELAKWGIDRDAWVDVVASAIEARGIVEAVS